MGRKAGGATKHTKIRPKVTVTTKPNLNTSKHPKVYRPKHVSTKNVQHHGAAYGTHQSSQTRVLQQQHRNLTVKIAQSVGYPQHHQQQQKRHVPVVIKTHQAKQHQVQQGSGVVKHGGIKKIKKKVIKPQGAGERPINLYNPFGL